MTPWLATLKEAALGSPISSACASLTPKTWLLVVEVLEAAQRFVPDERVIQWERREVSLRDAIPRSPPTWRKRRDA